MAKKRHTAEQIISKLREAEVLLATGTKMPQVCRKLGIFVACSVAHLQAVARYVNQRLDKLHRSQDPERVRDKIRMTHIDELLSAKLDLSFMLKRS